MRAESPCSIEPIIALIDGQLSHLEAADLRRHAQGCEVCSRALARVRGCLALTAMAPAPAFDPASAPAFLHRVRRGIRLRHGSPAPWWRPWAALAAGAAAGALCAVLVLGGAGHRQAAPDPVLAPPVSGARDLAGPWSEPVSVPPGLAADGDRLWASAVDAFLIGTATEADLLDQLESLLRDEAVLASLLSQ